VVAAATLTRKRRTVARRLAISLAMGLLYLGFLRAFEWDTRQRLLPYLGLWTILVVMGGAVCINAMSFDAMRVRAARQRRPAVAPTGDQEPGVDLSRRSARLPAQRVVGLAGGRPRRALQGVRLDDLLHPAVVGGRQRLVGLPVDPGRTDPEAQAVGQLKQFLIAFTVSYLIGYLVNLAAAPVRKPSG
jgi:hypothetical protein